MTKLVLNHLYKDYDTHKKALSDIHYECFDKTFLVIAGPSGCGKSTLLQIIAGLLEPTSGFVEMDNRNMEDVVPDKRGVAMVFQDAALFEHLSVQDNILYGLGKQCSHRDVALKQIVQNLQIEDLLIKKAGTLSGGQKQRVSIARALIRKPRFFLMDEPLQSLDEQLKCDLRLLIADLYQKGDATFIYVTHDQKEAMTLGKQMILMQDGKIIQTGTPQHLYQNPNSVFAARFMDKYRLNQWVKIDGSIEAIRSEHLHIVHGKSYEQVFTGRVCLLEEFGNGAVLHMDVNGQMFVVNGDANTYQKGQVLSIGYQKKDLLKFNKNGKRI